ncbi:MAG: potassium transporter TrkG [Candidatus Neomarinimicrobiota bacterium]
MKESIKKVFSTSLLAGIAALISLIAQYGFYLNAPTLDLFRHLDCVIALYFVLSYFVHIFKSNKKWKAIRSAPLESILLLLFVLSFITEGVLKLQVLFTDIAITNIKVYYIIVQIYVISNTLIALAKTRDNWLFISLKPSRIFIFSFFIVILIGVCLLKLPRASYNGISWINALFISTSAVCITGLTPLNIVDTFTPIGQGIILLLFQIGGLGIVTLTSFIALVFQQKGAFRFKDQVILMEILDDGNLNKIGEMLRSIIRITFVFELFGAALLWLRWGKLGLSPQNRLFSAIFHSVSAYCNAGFSNLQKGLETVGYNRDPVTMLTIIVLIIVGGLGFYTMQDILYKKKYNSGNRRHLTLQTRMILFISGTLILLGAIIVTTLQWKDWVNMPAWLRVLNGLFTSVTSRTAGFSTVSISMLSMPTLILVMLLMYIGASPNSTGGGIKVTTFGTLLAASWAFIRGKDRVEIAWNTIPMTTVRRSYIVLLGSLILITIAIFSISIVESAKFSDLLFEVISAFGNVGLSRGITPQLSGFSKIIITIVMFMGRVGLYTLSIAVGRESVVQYNYSFSETNIMVG